MNAPIATAHLSEDRRAFTLILSNGRGGRDWSGTYHISELPKWMKFYEDLIRRRKASEPFYRPCVKALERVKAELEASS